MELKIENYCMLCSVCADICPELFEMDENSGVMQVKCEKVPKELEQKALEAVGSCGVHAIIVMEE